MTDLVDYLRDKLEHADPNPLTPEVVRLRKALQVCWEALAYSYAGTRRPPAGKPEKRALWDAMHTAGDALGEDA